MHESALLHFHRRAHRRLDGATLSLCACVVPTPGCAWRVAYDRVVLPAATTIELGVDVPLHERAGVVTALSAHGVQTLAMLGVGIPLRDRGEPGSVAAISDHINYFGDHPLIGADLPEDGPRFVDMSRAYAPIPEAVLRETALTTGIYAGCTVEFATDLAHRRLLADLGADICGPCIVAESLAAAYCGAKVLAFTVEVGADLSMTDLDEQIERALMAMRTAYALLEKDTRQT